MLFVPHSLRGIAQLDAELRQITTADILEFDPFEVVPDALQFGSTPRPIAGALPFNR